MRLPSFFFLLIATCHLPLATCDLAVRYGGFKATCVLGHLPIAASGQQKVFHFDGDGIGPGRFVFGFAAQAKRG